MRSSWLLVAAAPLGALGIAPGFPTAPARAVPRPVLPRSRTDLPVPLDPLDAEALLDKPDIGQQALRVARLSTRRLARGYRRASEVHYLPMAATQSGLLRGAADAVGQVITHPGVPLDVSHAAVIATLGFLVSGYGGAVWLRHLESKLGSGTEPSDVLRKTATDYTCWAPFANSCYLFLVPLLTGHGFETATYTLQTGFLSVMALEASIFMPYNLLAFNSIPAPLRPPCGSLLAALFTIGFGIISSNV